MADRLITPHFGLNEFAQPAQPRYGLAAQPYPAEWIEPRLRPLCLLLEELRAEVARPITIICGYRSPAFNSALITHGHDVAQRSQHPEGRAADLEVPGIAAFQVHALVLRMYRAGALRQLGGLGLYPEFIHVDIRPRLGHDLAQWTGSRSAAATAAA